MLTLRAAAGLLAGDGTDVLARIAALCGCSGPPAALDAPTCEALGLRGFCGPAAPVAAQVARGPGVLRALLLEIDGGAQAVSLRDAMPRLAGRMARRAPHLSWLCVAAVRGKDRQLGLASWSVDRQPPRTAALVVDRDAVVDSDAETLCALSGPVGSDDALTHARWLAVLGRDALGRRFYRALARVVERMALDLAVPRRRGRPAHDDRRSLALLYASRLLFLAFLEAKGWLAGDRGFLVRTFTECLEGPGHYHARVLRPLFFGTLNTRAERRAPAARAFGRIPFLNGGLFGPTSLERRYRGAAFSDEVLGALFGEVLSRYRFTAREDRRSWSEAAVDPEMLGRAFESLMEPGERHATGAYYTPQALVERTTHEALAHALACSAAPPAAVAALVAGDEVPGLATGPMRDRLARIRVLDPACGSGAFLVYALEVLAAVAGRLGDARTVAERRRGILTRSIFGVDVSPMAVWLCELRLWLSVVIDAPAGDGAPVAPLPNLDRNVLVGDVLAGGAFAPAEPGAESEIARAHGGRRIMVLRDRYARSSGARKRIAACRLEGAERAYAIDATRRELARVAGERREGVAVARGRDLFGERGGGRAAAAVRRRDLRLRARALRARLRALVDGAALPFSFSVRFSDVETAGGFDVVVGNPPWVRPHAIPAGDRERLRRDFAVYRGAAWTTGAVAARAGAGFGGQVDLAALFTERAIDVCRAGGVVALLLPAKLWRSLAGGSLRRLVANETGVLAVEDWSAAGAAFDAATYPSLVVLRRERVQRPERARPGSAAGPGDADGAGHAGVAPTPVRSDGAGVVPSRGGGAGDAGVARADPSPDPEVAAVVHTRTAAHRWTAPASTLPFDESPGSPWILVPPAVRRAFDAVTASGVPLARTGFGPPLLGVKCGCNDAFLVVREDASLADVVPIRAADRASPPRRGAVERDRLRPVVRGETLCRWGTAAAASEAGEAEAGRRGRQQEWIVWTHEAGPGGGTAPLAELPPHAARWLGPWRHRLAARSDTRGRLPWWTIFRTEGAGARQPRVVWADFGRVPRAAVIVAGDDTVPLNTCYVTRTPDEDDAFALVALLNSAVAAAWLAAVAEPARGGYRRYFGWTVGLLPIPADWERARALLAPLGRRGAGGAAPANDALAGTVALAYGLSLDALAPLLGWRGA